MKCNVIVPNYVKVIVKPIRDFAKLVSDVPELRELFNKDLSENSLV